MIRHDCTEAEQHIAQLIESRDRAELRAERLEEAPTYGDGFAEALERAAALAELYETGKEAADAIRLVAKIVREESGQNHNETVMPVTDSRRKPRVGITHDTNIDESNWCKCPCHSTWRNDGIDCICCIPLTVSRKA